MFKAYIGAAFAILFNLYTHPLTARSCVRWMAELTKIDSCPSVYFTAVAFLHVASVAVLGWGQGAQAPQILPRPPKFLIGSTGVLGVYRRMRVYAVYQPLVFF